MDLITQPEIEANRRRTVPGWLMAGAAVLLSVLLYVVALPPFDLAEGAYVFAVPLLLWLFRQTRVKVAAVGIFAWSFLSWLIVIVWLRHVTVGGYVFVSAVMAGYFSLWFLAAWWVLRRVRQSGFAVRLGGIVVLAAVWVLHEYVRTFFLTGFPWLPLAASHWQRPLLLQIAAWTGAYGVSFILIFFNLGLAFYIDRLIRFHERGWRQVAPEFFVALGLLLLAGFVPFYLARNVAGEREMMFQAAVVQPYIPQTLKWDPSEGDEILRTLARTTLAMKDHPLEPDLVVWPEAVTPWAVVGNDSMRTWVERLAAEMEVPLFIGSVGVRRETDEWFNGVLVIDPEEGLSPHYYEKRKLVPFGEFIPFGALLSWMSKFVPLEGSFVHGQSADPMVTTIEGEKFRLGALICYEDVFPELARETVAAGAEVLIVVTNNAWYGEEGMPFQHAAHSVLRAVETRRPVIRSGNGGWSGWIDEYGLVREVLVDETGSIYFRGGTVFSVTRDTAWIGRESFYVQHGDWFVGLCGLIVLGAGVGGFVTRRRWRDGDADGTAVMKRV